MVNDFLTAWLVEGDVIASMGYVSERSYACLARDSDNPADFDRGLAPFQLMINMKAAHDALGSRASLDTVVVGAPLDDARVARGSGNRTRRSSSSTRSLTMSPPHSTVKAS